MDKLNENIITLYSKWKEGYTRKENSFKLRVRNFLSNRNNAGKFEISEDGKCLNASVNVYILEEDILDGKLPVPFGKVNGYFDCSDCPSLTSLEGAPKEVEGAFDCNNCKNLTSLVGVPEKVGDFFDCSECKYLTSLEGAPKEVGGDFKCSECRNLTSLEGAPEKVGGDFNCCICPKLTSLEYLPKEICGSLYIDKRFKGKIPDDVTIGGNRIWVK